MEALSCVGCESHIAPAGAHLQCTVCLLASHLHCAGDLFSPDPSAAAAAAVAAAGAAAVASTVCRLCRQEDTQLQQQQQQQPSSSTGICGGGTTHSNAADSNRKRKAYAASSSLPGGDELDAGGKRLRQESDQEEQQQQQLCALCGEGALGAADSAQPETCCLHRCHLACLTHWLDTVPSSRAERCPAAGCGARLNRLRVRPGGGEGCAAAAEVSVDPARLQAVCPVCLEPLTGQVATPDTCPGHQFCPPCLRNWTSHSRLCPNDRRPFSAVLLRSRAGSDDIVARVVLPQQQQQQQVQLQQHNAATAPIVVPDSDLSDEGEELFSDDEYVDEGDDTHELSSSSHSSGVGHHDDDDQVNDDDNDSFAEDGNEEDAINDEDHDEEEEDDNADSDNGDGEGDGNDNNEAEDDYDDVDDNHVDGIVIDASDGVAAAFEEDASIDDDEEEDEAAAEHDILDEYDALNYANNAYGGLHYDHGSSSSNDFGSRDTFALPSSASALDGSYADNSADDSNDDIDDDEEGDWDSEDGGAHASLGLESGCRR